MDEFNVGKIMATRISVNCSLQTGVWDMPQVISFDSLFNKYSTTVLFEASEHQKITSVIDKWKKLAPTFMNSLNANALSLPRSPFAKSIETDPECSISYTISERTAHTIHKETPGILYKIYERAPELCHPMANTLRAPMSDFISHTISEENLTEVGVVEEALFPLISKEKIETLNERKINEAFIICSKTIPIYGLKETIKKVREMSEEVQQRLANQCCLLPLKTGISDFGWHNLNMHQENGKLYLLDTEPLFGELFINKFGKGFETCKNMVYNLNICAQNGLSQFNRSSQEQELEIFENTAQTFLEKITI